MPALTKMLRLLGTLSQVSLPGFAPQPQWGTSTRELLEFITKGVTHL